MTTDKDKPEIGFIGLGGMGRRMALRLLGAGYPLTVYNRSRPGIELLVQQGARAAETPSALAASCDYVLSCLTDDLAVESVYFGRDGILAGAHAGVTCIDLSTVAPATSRRLAAASQARDVAALDAPVSGSTPQAEAGTLVIFVGGEMVTYQRCQPLLDVLGTSFRMGPSGMGTTMKLVVNTLLGVGMQALAEAIVLGEKAGLERDLLLDVLGQTAVLTPGQKGKLENVRRSDYPVTFPLRLMHKDFGLVLHEAAEHGVAMPVTALAQQLATAELAKGRDEDFSAVIRFMQELARV